MIPKSFVSIAKQGFLVQSFFGLLFDSQESPCGETYTCFQPLSASALKRMPPLHPGGEAVTLELLIKWDNFAFVGHDVIEMK